MVTVRLKVNGVAHEGRCEPRKLLGRLHDGRIVEPPLTISAQVTRVAVTDGHTALLAIGCERKPTVEEALEALEGFQAPEQVRGLPSAPAQPLVVRREADRPQPRRDRDAGKGMSASVGRVRTCPLLDLRLYRRRGGEIVLPPSA